MRSFAEFCGVLRSFAGFCEFFESFFVFFWVILLFFSNGFPWVLLEWVFLGLFGIVSCGVLIWFECVGIECFGGSKGFLEGGSEGLKVEKKLKLEYVLVEKF